MPSKCVTRKAPPPLHRHFKDVDTDIGRLQRLLLGCVSLLSCTALQHCTDCPWDVPLRCIVLECSLHRLFLGCATEVHSIETLHRLFLDCTTEVHSIRKLHRLLLGCATQVQALEHCTDCSWLVSLHWMKPSPIRPVLTFFVTGDGTNETNVLSNETNYTTSFAVPVSLTAILFNLYFLTPKFLLQFKKYLYYQVLDCFIACLRSNLPWKIAFLMEWKLRY